MVEEHFLTPRPIRLEVKVPAAEIEITTVDGEESTVAVDGSDRALDDMRVELVGERLVVEQQRTSFLGWFGRSAGSVRVRATVPHHARVQILTASGDARLEGTFDGLDVATASGAVRVEGDINGDTSVKTVSGDVRVTHVAGDLRVHTVSGDVAAQAVDGSLAVRSVSGHTRVGALREGRATVQCVSGNIELGIVRGTTVDVDASSASGELSSDFPLSETPPDESGPTLVLRGTTVSGNLRVFRACA